MSVGQLINLLGTLASIVIAGTALLTVLEIKAQRRDAQRPEVTPVRQTVEATKPKDYVWHWPVSWHEPSSVQSASESASLLEYNIRLHNIGTGPAKNVSVTWEYPLEKLVESINRICQQGNQDFHLEHAIDKMFLSIKSIDKDKDAMFNKTTGIFSSREFILPSSLQKDPSSVPIPLAFILLNSVCAALTDKTKLVFSVLEQVANIDLNVEYSDVLENKYTSSFKCTLEHSFISKGEFSGEVRFDHTSPV